MISFFLLALFYVCAGFYYPLLTMDNREDNLFWSDLYCSQSLIVCGEEEIDTRNNLDEYYSKDSYCNDQYMITVINSIPLSITIENKDKNNEVNFNDTELISLMNCFLSKKCKATDDDGYDYYYSVKNNLEPFFTKNNNKTLPNKLFLECFKHSPEKSSTSLFSFDLEYKVIARLVKHKNQDPTKVNTIFISNAYDCREATITIEPQLDVDSFSFYKERGQLYLIACSYISSMSKNTYCLDCYNLTNVFGIIVGRTTSSDPITQKRCVIKDPQNSDSVLKILTISDEHIVFSKEEANKQKVINFHLSYLLDKNFSAKYLPDYKLNIMYFWQSNDNTVVFSTDEMLKIFPQPSNNVRILKNTYPCPMSAPIEQLSPHKKEETLREQKSNDKPTREQKARNEKQPNARIYSLLKSFLHNHYIIINFGTIIIVCGLLSFYNY